ncbi:MAG: tRNA preQ1(34) S-adenosylmethionine ribosyltransferase-isomerase QueA [Minisyncoccia bacterium]|jgi:S-adenosylmethionine:tRNA ribosyltransferase-isomerase
MSDSDYNYILPKGFIANAPADPRDASRLFVYSIKTNEIVLDTFANLARYVPAGSVLVINDTKVVPARLELSNLSGRSLRVLILFNEWDGGPMVKGLPDKDVATGEPLFWNERPCLEAASHVRQEFTFRLLMPAAEFERLCEKHGQTPLPPYIHTALPEKELREKYQTTFAANPSSVAAPTASLHFTPGVFRSLDDKDVKRAAVTLHVGRGTFSPVSSEMASTGKLYPEPIQIGEESARMVAEAKRAGRTVVAAGTTSVRLLESVPEAILEGKGYHGETTLFIRPPYRFVVVDALLTNFHLPGTSLLMLLDAFLRFKGAKKSWRDLYDRAIEEKFRFYSFGDAMLII